LEWNIHTDDERIREGEVYFLEIVFSRDISLKQSVDFPYSKKITVSDNG